MVAKTMMDVIAVLTTVIQNLNLFGSEWKKRDHLNISNIAVTLKIG